jgi:hypothetical protein
MSDLTSRIVSYEQGEMDQAEMVALFQELYDTGLAWNLQGHYGRTTYQMLQEGLISK